ncbi:MAG: HAD-IB family hydrolase, partial [Acidimicrobiia bacterium]|nr:HAD-IB family hydrolase [Acidimicrobiia bacterium]
PLAGYLGVDDVIATRAGVDEQGLYTGELEYYAYGPTKAEALHLLEQEGIDLSESYAYSDSQTDLPLLEAVGHPVVVNPDRELRKIAEEREWPIREFTLAVDLRTRLAEMPKPDPIISSAALATGIAAVLAVVLLRSKRKG